ncbi:FG-GAP-like repeat-containing protein [Tunicatimonas pelagia]|uniref:FG-GAP-like repeat-containing protein n=1 Tax=Tunicatimonas pelagia TaxID=931531 RepID=UPI0026651550|nr:FG-GAP-like repeat-containing protein [Tunicatimonas pelagia]WKN40930.1 FG-GAP-like repeat-containing protein [Tunicatimonas pelagia]
MRKFLFTFIFSLCTAVLLAQAPVITQLDKTRGTVFEVVTIQGSGFGTDTANVDVFFGGVLADSIAPISSGVPMLDTEIQVLVPPGATTSSVSVTRTDTRLTAYSPEVFYISYDGGTFDRNFMDGPYKYATSGNNLYNLCFCDFNQDGLNDIATSDLDSEEITVLQNTTPNIDTVTFTPVELDIEARTRWLRCGDLNGDGLPELVFAASNDNAEGGNLAYVYQNTSTGGVISFDLADPIRLPIEGNLAARMVIRDIDMDGKPDITVADISADGGVSVFLNNSTGSTISFVSTPSLPFAVFGISSTELSGIAVEDFSGDGIPDIAVSEDENSGIYVITNISTPSSLGFGALTELTASGRTTNLKAGDLDNDGLIDLVVVNDSYVGALRNTSQNGVVSFASPVRFDQTNLGREGLELVDIDGNGLLDIAVAAQNRNWIVLLLNKSTLGSLDFNTKQVLLADENSLSVRGGDLNGDGKPDLAYTETATDQIAIQLNRNCITPVLEPQGGLGVCDQLPYQLSVTKAIGAEYVWESSGDGTSFTPMAEATDSTFTFTTSNEIFYRVRVSSTNKTFVCSPTASNQVEVVRPDGFVPSKPTIVNKNPAEPVCFGESISLQAETVNAEYFWTGPNDFSSNDPNPVIPDADKTKEGVYVLYVQASEENGGCVSDTATTFVKVSEPEAITATAGQVPVFFEGSNVQLTVNPVDGQTFGWRRNDETIADANELSFTTNSEGTYVAVTQNAEGCLRESNPIEVAFARPEISAELCLNEAGQFVISPDSLNGQEIWYRWIFEGNTEEGDTVSYQFTNAGTQTVAIEILSGDGAVRDRYEQTMEVLEIPNLAVQAASNPNLCPNANVVLEANEGFATYLWNTQSTERSITVSQPGTYILTVTAENGCNDFEEFTVEEADNPVGEITASTDRIALGDTLQLQALGGDTYQWESDISLSDSTIANPLVRPLVTTTYICVIINEAGCADSVEFTVMVDRQLDVVPERAFTPNNDGNNDTWYIEKMELYPDCRLTLFNRQGIKLYEQENYSNLQPWDGTANGTLVPPGVYFYLINCGEEAGTQTGSVTIIR